MNKRVILPVQMKLCSDAVFGSGYSIPGGEDVAVCRDEGGLPYMRGATWKGLLRESLENLAAWGEGSQADVTALMGEADWNGLTDGRRVRLTGLTLTDPPVDPEECFDLRTFTSLEDGVVKGGTLRTVSCIQAGLIFEGELECDEGDLPLLRDALSGIKWTGTQRSRGFGRVRFTTGETRGIESASPAAAGTCLRLRLTTELPVVLTDPNRSDNNAAETYGFIPGAAIRGAVMEILSAEDPAWFAAHKADLLGIRFLDALPVPEESPSRVPLPSLRGFYEDKDEKALECVVKNGDFTPGFKRAKLGTFCAPEGDTLHYWSARTGSVTRIQRGRDGEDTKLFQVCALSAGQKLEGYILLGDPALGERLTRALGKSLWLGADRYAGYGKCSVRAEAVPRPAWQEVYGCRDGDTPEEELYLLAVSPFTMLNDSGEPCGLDEEKLAKRLGVNEVKVQFCATSLVQAGGYNRVWGCRAPSVRFYDRGSLFRLRCNPAPTADALRRVQREGLGIRQAEGFGQVLFLPAAQVDGLQKKSRVSDRTAVGVSPQAGFRRAAYRWVMDHTGELNACGLSRSQVGTIQALCEKAMSKGGDWRKLEEHLEHNLKNRGAIHGARFQKADRLIRDVLTRPLRETLELESCPDGTVRRLELLCLLFDHSRKGREDG